MNGVLFDRDSLAPHIPPEQYGLGTTFVDVSFLCEEDNEIELKDKMFRVMVLSCSKRRGNDDRKRIQSTSLFGQNKRARFSKESTYNSFFLVADLESPPNCATILPRSTDESSQLLAFLTGGPFVGEPFFVYEPNKVGSTLGDHTPILSLKNSPFLPLRDPSSAICSTEANMAIPSKVGETNYFILTKKTITFSKVRLAANLTCQGVMCDRQKDKNGCSCLHVTGILAVVYKADAILKYLRPQSQASRLLRQRRCSSPISLILLPAAPEVIFNKAIRTSGDGGTG
jgi:hypothetical protein